MNDNTLTPDRYAGDEAWQDWFDICSVGGCPAEHTGARRLFMLQYHCKTNRKTQWIGKGERYEQTESDGVGIRNVLCRCRGERRCHERDGLAWREQVRLRVGRIP